MLSYKDIEKINKSINKDRETLNILVESFKKESEKLNKLEEKKKNLEEEKKNNEEKLKMYKKIAAKDVMSTLKNIKLSGVKELNTDLESTKRIISKLSDEIKSVTSEIKIVSTSKKSKEKEVNQMKNAIEIKKKMFKNFKKITLMQQQRKIKTFKKKYWDIKI